MEHNWGKSSGLVNSGIFQVVVSNLGNPPPQTDLGSSPIPLETDMARYIKGYLTSLPRSARDIKAAVNIARHDLGLA